MSNYIEHPASGKTGTFAAKYDQYAENNGQSFTVLGAVDPKTYDAEECGTMYSIRFADGAEMIQPPRKLGFALGVAQAGQKHDAAKPLKGFGSAGVLHHEAA